MSNHRYTNVFSLKVYDFFLTPCPHPVKCSNGSVSKNKQSNRHDQSQRPQTQFCAPHNSNRAVECNFLRMSSFYASTSFLFREDYKLTNLSSYRVEKLNNVSPDWATSLVSECSTLGQVNCEFSPKDFKINNSRRNCP